jgi:NADH dehydrogenase/NADH:ubiquinone oxidoreductase subunit G
MVQGRSKSIAAMISKRYSIFFLFLLLAAGTNLCAQHSEAKLTEKEIEDVRESAVVPVERVKLYTKFLEERAGKIKDLSGRPKSGQRVLKLNDALEDFTALMDEMGSNLDQYSDRHSDIRKALKPLSEAMPHWLTILRSLPGESGFDLARKEAIESGEELADQTNRLLKEQDDYFATHKDEKGQERNDDQVKPN